MEEENEFTNKDTIIDSDVLNEYDTSEQRSINLNYADDIKEIINNTFIDFGVDAVITGHVVSPNVIRFALKTGSNVSIKTLNNLISDIQIRLGGVPVRLDTTSKNMRSIGLEVEAKAIETVSFKSLYESLPDKNKHPLAVPLGVNVSDERVWIDLEDAPHVLVCGTNGSGMSLFMNAIVLSLIMRNSPQDLKLALFDPKMVEFNRFNDIPTLLCPIIRDSDTAFNVLNGLVEEMNERYAKILDFNCCSIKEYNEYAIKHELGIEPHIIVCIDEYDNLVTSNKEIAGLVLLLAQKGKAAGIHLIVGIRNPSTNVISGALKANLPIHIGMMMASIVDSYTILGESGAEKLAGKGDMLVQSHLISKLGLVRLQGCYVHKSEIKRVVDILKEEYPLAYYRKYEGRKGSSKQGDKKEK